MARSIRKRRFSAGESGLNALAALDAAVADLPLESAQQAWQRQQRAAWADVSAPKSRAEQPEEKHV